MPCGRKSSPCRKPSILASHMDRSSMKTTTSIAHHRTCAANVHRRSKICSGMLIALHVADLRAARSAMIVRRAMRAEVRGRVRAWDCPRRLSCPAVQDTRTRVRASEEVGAVVSLLWPRPTRPTRTPRVEFFLGARECHEFLDSHPSKKSDAARQPTPTYSDYAGS